MDKNTLTRDEEQQLISLLEKLESPWPRDVFLAMMKINVSIPVDLLVLNQQGQMLLLYRNDSEYEGYYLPGTVLRNNDTVSTALDRIFHAGLPGIKTTKPVSLGWTEIEKGTAVGQNPTRHEISLLHACELVGDYVGAGTFFSPDALPENTLSHHKVSIPEMIERLKNVGN